MIIIIILFREMIRNLFNYIDSIPFKGKHVLKQYQTLFRLTNFLSIFSSDAEGDILLSVLMAQGLPTALHVTSPLAAKDDRSFKKADLKKALSKQIEDRYFIMRINNSFCFFLRMKALLPSILALEHPHILYMIDDLFYGFYR